MSPAKPLATLLEERWNLKPVSIEPIKVRENAVFAVRCADGGKLVARVHRRGYHSDAALSSERTWMQALAAEGIEVPRHVLSRDGGSFEMALVEGFAEPRQVDVFHWIDGRQLGSIEHGVSAAAGEIGRVYRDVGRLAARVHNQSSAWNAPTHFSRHSWDVAGLAGEKPFWGRFWDLEALSSGERRLFVRLREALLRDLPAVGTTPDRYGLIHADLVPENILVEGSNLQVIDFDDAGFGWHLFEIATSLYFIRRDPVYEEARESLIEGYRQIRSLSEAQLRLLPMFLAARGSTYLGWVHTRSTEPAAREMAPQLIELAAAAAEDYLSGS
jgi:Ser/Thr protein kinase RdoA (MazF antagonist)